MFILWDTFFASNHFGLLYWFQVWYLCKNINDLGGISTRGVWSTCWIFPLRARPPAQQRFRVIVNSWFFCHNLYCTTMLIFKSWSFFTYLALEIIYKNHKFLPIHRWNSVEITGLVYFCVSKMLAPLFLELSLFQKNL